MPGQESADIIADLMAVYRSASASASEATQRSRNPELPMMERLKLRHQAHQQQELAEQALRMVNELSAKVAA